MLLHEVNIKNFHPEQNRPKSQLLLNCRSQALPPLQKFLMGLGNYFYLFPKKRKLFAELGKRIGYGLVRLGSLKNIKSGQL